MVILGWSSKTLHQGLLHSYDSVTGEHFMTLGSSDFLNLYLMKIDPIFLASHNSIHAFWVSILVPIEELWKKVHTYSLLWSSVRRWFNWVHHCSGFKTSVSRVWKNDELMLNIWHFLHCIAGIFLQSCLYSWVKVFRIILSSGIWGWLLRKSASKCWIKDIIVASWISFQFF